MFTSKYTWQVRERTEKLSEEIIKEHKLNHLEQTLLENRGFYTQEKVDSIITPNEYNYQYMPNINEASDLIKKHLEAESRILIYGDYDADGITSTAILYDALKAQNENVYYFIPNRIEHGYGPNYDFFEFEVVGNVDLVITVDNGINAVKEMALLKENDIDARNTLIVHNLRLVVFVAKKFVFKTKSFTLLDLVQEGTIGLMKSFEKHCSAHHGFRIDPMKTVFYGVCASCAGRQKEVHI